MRQQYRAPGRANLIGEHTDYNEGLVMPVAIELETIATVEPSSVMHWTSANHPPAGWEKHVAGVERQLRLRGIDVPPVRIHFESTVPLGAGLSSSAALEVSAALAMLGAAGAELSPMEIAILCQQAEVETVGLECGVMDPFIAMHGEQGKAVLLDCRSLEFEAVPVPEGIALVIADTGIKHELAASEYNTRRAECEAAARALNVSSLRDANDDGGHGRARHVIGENLRVRDFATALRGEDRQALGELMAASHESLRVDFEVSCPELDRMVALGRTCSGWIGSRMTGGGFGGATIHLVEHDAAQRFASELSQRYGGAATWVTRAVSGASRVDPQNP